MDASYITALVGLAAAVEAAGHGEKELIYQRACAELGKSRATIMKHLNQVAVRKPRKQRSDAGAVALSLEDAVILSAYLMAGYRKNQRKITSLTEAVDILRRNGAITAGQVDLATGEIVPLSDSAIARALRVHVLHPEQLRQHTPFTPLQSRHPNHVWEVDASVCVIYYLPDGGSQMVELDDAVHYKNKPQNLKAIEQFRVIRYVLADHASGVVRYRYYPHAESGEHTVRFLAWAMAKRAGDPFHGAPLMVMVDPGATSGGLVQRFCLRMGIELIVNKCGNARAKGAVEKANHLVETSFEQTLRFLKPRPANFEQLNTIADQYQLWWNDVKIHSRTGKSRFAAWLTITPMQLRITPSAEVLLQLATRKPEKRQVKGDLTVSFMNRTWNVEDVPGVTVKGAIFVHWHPFMDDTAMAVIAGENGHEQHIALPEIKKNALGFQIGAAVIGEEYKARPDTVADTNRKLVHQLAAGTTTLAETEAKRSKTHFTPFDGKIDPLIASKDKRAAFLPKTGTLLAVMPPEVTLVKRNAAQMAIWLHGRLGDDWSGSMLVDIKKRFPEGATEPELEQVLDDLKVGRTAAGRGQLRVV